MPSAVPLPNSFSTTSPYWTAAFSTCFLASSVPSSTPSVTPSAMALAIVCRIATPRRATSGKTCLRKRGPKSRVEGTTLTYAERSEEHTSELQSRSQLVRRLLLEKTMQANHDREEP